MPFFQKKRIGWRVGREIETNVWTHIGWGVALIVAIAVMFGIIWYLTRLPAVTVSTINVEGGETITEAEVRSVVEGVLRDSYLRIIPFTFTYLVPNERIVSALESIPRIRDVHVERTSRSTLTISFGEYMPDALWCMNTDELSDCYFLDVSGYAFSIAPPLRGGSLVRHIVAGSEKPAERQLFDAVLYTRMTNFIHALDSELGLRVTHVTHAESGDSTYRVGGGGDILVVTDVDVEPVLNNLKALLESKEFKHLEPGNFKYIDLRFGKKVFVNEDLSIPTTTASTTME